MLATVHEFKKIETKVILPITDFYLATFSFPYSINYYLNLVSAHNSGV